MSDKAEISQITQTSSESGKTYEDPVVPTAGADAFETLIAEIMSEFAKSVQNRMFSTLCGASGLRIGEALALEVGEID